MEQKKCENPFLRNENCARKISNGIKTNQENIKQIG